MPGVDGSEQHGDLLFEYPVHKKTERRTKFYILALFLAPLLIVLLYNWPLSGTCLLVWIIFTLALIFASLTDFLEPSPSIEVHQHRMKVRAEEFHPDELEYIETYFDHGHVGNKVEKHPHYVFIFHWSDQERQEHSYELPLRMGKEEHSTVVEGLKRAIPGIRILELPEKKLRLKK